MLVEIHPERGEPMSDADLVPTPEAARILGVPDDEFTRLAKALDLQAARPGSKTQPRLWHRALIEQLHRGPEGEELREAVARKEKVRAIRHRLAERYPDWRQALRPAAEALFNFNRLTKHGSCSRLRQRELYDLKDKVIRLLYELGLCQEASLHAVEGCEVECDVCDGAGRDWRDLACVRCDGKGVLTPDGPLEFVLFCFLIDGQWFEWHAPRKGVQWPFTPTEAAERRRDWKPKAGTKPVMLTSEVDFLEAEAHLRFVLRNYDEGQEQKKQEERKRRAEQMRREGLERQARLRAEREAAGDAEPG
jgi:hypothetical protein